MKKEEYLAIKEVADFIRWFASDEAQNFSHNYTQLKPCKTYNFNGLPDALIQYEWKGSLENNTNLLNKLKNKLRKSFFKEENFESYRASTKELMKWGGTQNGNNAWFENENNLKIVKNTLEVLNQHNDDIQILKRIDGLRFNSGLTKLYSLIVNDFIIYDSRVAAALAWYVYKYYGKNIPNELKFACMNSRFSKKINRGHIRKPSNEFPLTNQNNHSIHAHWNIRASWVLSEAVILMPNSTYHNQKNVEPVRALEAALFMWGYDLSNIT